MLSRHKRTVQPISFNPRPREGGDTDVFHPDDGPTVSIRAPVKGAMLRVLEVPERVVVSIRAPVKGAMGGVSAAKPSQ